MQSKSKLVAFAELRHGEAWRTFEPVETSVDYRVWRYYAGWIAGWSFVFWLLLFSILEV